MRVAFFGGSFDPPHRGHIAIALAAANRLELDRVVLAPVGSQPLKAGRSGASYVDRLAMVRLACAPDARLIASEIDAPRPGQHNYTFDRLSRLRGELSPETHLFCLLGADSFHTLAHWHRATELLLLCDFIIAARPGYDLGNLQERLPAGIAIGGQFDTSHDGRLRVAHLQGSTIQASADLYVMLDLEEDVSATALRGTLALKGNENEDELAPEVAGYIGKHGLYREQTTAH